MWDSVVEEVGGDEGVLAKMWVKNVKTDDPGFKNANFTHAKNAKPNMKGAIDAFTPTKKIAGATAIKNHGGRDIKGTKFDTIDFYGCIKY
jgi:hypothetical protein